jgi:phosphohistidine phosphatase
MITLILVRHAKAAPRSRSRPDDVRPLTPEGREQAHRTGEIVRGLVFPGARVLCSPKRRALETAEAIATGLESEARPETRDCLRGDCEPDEILRALASSQSNCLVLVGHEPDMGRLLARLLDPAWRGTIPFPPAGYAHVQVDALPPTREGRLRAFGGP